MMDLEKLQKQKKLMLALGILTGFMAAMKFLGVFAIGVFPPIFELLSSIFCLVVFYQTTQKIKKIQTKTNEFTDKMD